MKFVFRNIMFLFNLIFVIAFGLACISPFVNPNVLWPIGFFGLTFKVWLLANFVLLLFWLALKKKLWVYNLIILIIGSPIILRDIQFNKSEGESDGEIRMMLFNTRVQQIYNEGNTSEEIYTYTKDNDFDLVVLVEWFNKKGYIDENAYPYQQFVRLQTARNKYDYGLMLASKHKILHWERIEYGHVSDNMTAFFDLEIGEEVVRVIATHLQSNSLGAGDYHKFLDFNFDDESTTHAKTVVSQMRKSMARRAIQTTKILEVIEESPYPVIIMGDFNDTPQSFAYQQLRQGRKDAFIERGYGFGASYLEPFPVLRIDYILYDPDFECTAYKSNTEIESDHKIITANFKF